MGTAMLAFGKADLAQKAIVAASVLPGLGPAVVAAGLRLRIAARAVTAAKVRNFMLANRESVARAVTVRSLPYVLNIDTNNVCNLACPFCPTGTRQLERRKSRLGFDQVRRIVDLTRSHVLAVRFYNWGEPFINPDIFEMIRYTAAAGIHTTVSSNLSVKGDGLAERIVDSGLDNLHVSVDGLEQATLERYRRKADAARVFGNVARIVEVRRARRSRTPRLELVFLVFRHNEHELPRLPRLRRELGVDVFRASAAFINHADFVPEDPRYLPLQTIFRHSCHYLYSELTIEADGGISPCCTNSSASFDVGSLDDVADLRALWNGPDFVAMRAKNAGITYLDAAGARRATLCDHCSFIGDVPRSRALSPRPPALVAAGVDFDHGLDDASAVPMQRVDVA
jgi:pyruvate-formate lyase-activating enzyme